MKTLKIPPKVHTELKTFCAIHNESMETYAAQAILATLRQDGHKFVFPKNRIKSTNNKSK